MKSQMNNKQMVQLSYYRGLFDLDELEKQKARLSNAGIEFSEYDKSGIIMHSVDNFTNMVSLAINSTLVQGLLFGVLTNGSYDILKNTIVWMWNSLRNKSLTKIHSGERIEEKEVTFGLDLCIDNTTRIGFRLSGDVSDELKINCIDKAFKLAKTYKRKSVPMVSEFAKFDWEKGEWYLVDIYKEIQKIIEQQQRQV
jgi:hypothetical protein